LHDNKFENMIDFKKYIKELQSVSIDELTEHSKRFALETLLREVAETVVSKNEIKVLHEPKRKDNYGSPDFKIYTESSIIGYIENKKITENLDKVLKSAQIKKYRELSPNILLTNYLDFVWIKGDNIQRETLCSREDLTGFKNLSGLNSIGVTSILTNFFSEAPIGIATAKDLAFALAIRSKNLKDFLNDDLENQENVAEKTRLVGLYDTFKSHIFNELTISEFADAFAQMLVYGLFLAKLNADTKEVTLYNAKRYIPQSFELIRELVGFLDELDDTNYKDTRWIIDEVISIMNNLDLPELQKTLQFSKKVKDNDNIETDPYIYFYETFLAAYDKKLRKAKGVYYTPPQVVNFIVRSVNEVLKNTFKIENGFAQPEEVTVLDFATGTGTFLIEILKQIFDSIPAQNNQFKEMLIKDHILKNIYGFEYLIAPYTVAHLKLSQFLKENNYVLQDNERFQLFLTNTLEPIADIPPNLYAKSLSREGKLAQKVKDKAILVITGNPPYSGHSKNTGDWITNLLKGNDIWATEKIEKQADYYKVDGKPLGERNPKWLQDDYVKFIRFAQYKIDRAGQGVVGIITNHSFLDNPTFRGMRQSLMQSFDQLYFIDLHGNSKKKEKTPEGKADQNVFDIEQGVAISIFIKKPGLKKGVFHTDFWGSRKQKFDLCIDNSVETLDFSELKPKTPFYLFTPQNEKLWEAYKSFWSVKDIFILSNVGVVTAKDDFVINENKEVLLKRFNEFKFSERDKRLLHEKFNLKEKKSWDIIDAWESLKKETDLNQFIKPINYRIFEKKYIFYAEKFIERKRTEVMQHFQNGNKALVTTRQVSTGSFYHSFISEYIFESSYVSNKTREITYGFPLYLYENQTKNIFKQDKPEDAIFRYKEELKKHTDRLKYDEETLRKSEEFFKLYKNPKVEEVNIIEEARAIFEEQKTIYEKAKVYFEDLIKITQKQIETEKQNNVEYLENDIVKRPNFSNNFLKFVKQKYPNYTPEKVLGYIYAILHSPTYREKYADFLKIDFPKIPFCEDEKTFERLSKLGNELIEYHLLNEIPQGKEYKDLVRLYGEGDSTINKITFVEGENGKNRLYVNNNIYFEHIPNEVYEFYIGGYQVLNKYLKDRKGKELNMNEVLTVGKIVKVLTFTIKQMKLIDNETNEWI